MSELAKKRTAHEPVEALLGNHETAQQPTRRPVTTALGAVLVFLRGIGGAAVLIYTILFWHEFEIELQGAGIDASDVYPWLVAISAVTIFVLLLLVVLVWRGNNGARIAVMCWVTLSTVTTAVGHFTLGEQITLQTTLVLVALDVLVLLALSSKDSRAWSRLSRADRQAIVRGLQEVAGT